MRRLYYAMEYMKGLAVQLRNVV